MNETILVSYNQICVFDAAMENPFNDWTEEHIQQGFSWREGSVSFGAIENSETTIVVQILNSFVFDDSSFRVIEVPFVVPQGGLIVIGSIGDEREIEIASGTYNLTYELAKKDNKPWCRFSFSDSLYPTARILRADSEIKKIDALIMEARPAV